MINFTWEKGYHGRLCKEGEGEGLCLQAVTHSRQRKQGDPGNVGCFGEAGNSRWLRVRNVGGTVGGECGKILDSDHTGAECHRGIRIFFWGQWRLGTERFRIGEKYHQTCVLEC